MSGEILTRDEVAILLDCEPETIDLAARRGELPGVKYGRSWVFPHDALLEYLNQRALVELPSRAPKEKTAPLSAVHRAPLVRRKRVID